MRPSSQIRLLFLVGLSQLIGIGPGQARMITKDQMDNIIKFNKYLAPELKTVYSEAHYQQYMAWFEELKTLRVQVNNLMAEGYVRTIEKDDLVALKGNLDSALQGMEGISSRIDTSNTLAAKAFQQHLDWLKSVGDLTRRILPEFHLVVDKDTFAAAYAKIQNFRSLLPPTADLEKAEAALSLQLDQLVKQAAMQGDLLTSITTTRQLKFFSLKNGESLSERLHALQNEYNRFDKPFSSAQQHILSRKKIRNDMVDDIQGSFFKLIKMKLNQSIVADAQSLIAKYDNLMAQDELYSSFFASLEERNRTFSSYLFDRYCPYTARRIASESIAYLSNLERGYSQIYPKPIDIIVSLFAKYKDTFNRNLGSARLAITKKQQYDAERVKKTRFYLDRFGATMSEDCKKMGNAIIAQEDDPEEIAPEITQEEKYAEFLTLCR